MTIQTDVLIMDFSKVFDKVSHNLLMHKLKHYGIRGKINNCIESFLSGRTQAVIIEGEKGHQFVYYYANFESRRR
jgi:hypothetical protein